MANCCNEQSTYLCFVHDFAKITQMNQAVHHLGHTEAMSKIMKWIISVISLNTYLFTRKLI